MAGQAVNAAFQQFLHDELVEAGTDDPELFARGNELAFDSAWHEMVLSNPVPLRASRQ